MVIVLKDKELIQDIEAEGMSYLASMEDESTNNRIMERGGRLFYGAPCMIVVPIDPVKNNDMENELYNGKITKTNNYKKLRSNKGEI